MQLPEKAVLYAGDPMCSWCYGFSPVLQQAMNEYDSLPFIPIMGGMRPAALAEDMDDRMSRFLLHHWKQVEKATGRPFDYSILSRRDFQYNTEPSCRAVVAVREMEPSRAFPYFFALQSAFYAEGRNPTDEQTFADIAEQTGIDRTAFLKAYHSEEVGYEMRQDFQLCQGLQVTGFPSMLYLEGNVAWPISRGFRELDDLRKAIDHTLNAASNAAKQNSESAAEGQTCSVDGSNCT